MRGPGDAIYHGELQAGAEYLAGRASDPAERALHLGMARVYRSRGRDAAESPPATEAMAR
jgi:hypothetical protein